MYTIMKKTMQDQYNPISTGMSKMPSRGVITLKQSYMPKNLPLTKPPRRKSLIKSTEDAIQALQKNKFALTEVQNSPEVLARNNVFYPCYIGFEVSKPEKKTNSTHGYKIIKKGPPTLAVSADVSGVVVLSADYKHLFYRFAWDSITGIEQMFNNTANTPMRKRSKKNYIAIYLDDGSQYVIGSRSAPELLVLIQEKHSSPTSLHIITTVP